jgi:hypothetical protein
LGVRRLGSLRAVEVSEHPEVSIIIATRIIKGVISIAAYRVY